MHLCQHVEIHGFYGHTGLIGKQGWKAYLKIWGIVYGNKMLYLAVLKIIKQL